MRQHHETDRPPNHRSSMRRAVLLPNIGDPAALVELAVIADRSGWDGCLLWDTINMPQALDPWVLLGAMASRTERVVLGTGVTPPSRRHPQKLAKEVVTLDHLSGGRAVLGIGLGAPADEEFVAFGDDATTRHRAARTDEALEILDRMLRGAPVDHSGEHYRAHAHLRPAAMQSPRPPIWIAATPPHSKGLERAARWDGVFCNAKVDQDMEPLTPNEVHEYTSDLIARSNVDLICPRHPDHPASAYREVGVTWLVDACSPDEPDWSQQLGAHLQQELAFSRQS